MSEAERDERRELRQALQSRILTAEPILEAEAKQVLRQIRKALKEAYDDDVLSTPPEKVYANTGQEKPDADSVVEIWGGLVDGKKPLKRRPEHRRLVRDDGAWLHFTLKLQCASAGKHKGKKVDALWAYDFELVFPEGHIPPFVRFDLNEPEHPNEDRELRSHLHPGNDDLLVPAPLMNPDELIDVLLRRLRNPRNKTKSRG